MGFILSNLTHQLEADAPQSMMFPVSFSSPDLCLEISPGGGGNSGAQYYNLDRVLSLLELFEPGKVEAVV